MFLNIKMMKNSKIFIKGENSLGKFSNFVCIQRVTILI